MTEKYNWWDDPKNAEEIKQLSWWDNPENKEVYSFPISVVKSDNYYVAACNDETKKLIGDILHGCAQGKTKDEAIKRMFNIIKLTCDYYHEESISYSRWVPFRKGNWKHTGGKWFIIFGINVYFRYGKNMRGGWFVPMTNLNISISNEWKSYNRWKKNKNENNK